MRKRACAKRSRPRSTSRLIQALATLVIAVLAYSCSDLPVARKLEAAGAGMQKLAVDLARRCARMAALQPLALPQCLGLQHARTAR